MFQQQQLRNALRASSVCVLMLAACAGTSTTVEESWSAPDIRSGSVHKVATLYVSNDGARRRGIEDRLSQMLNSKGVPAVSSYQVLTGDDLDNKAVAKAKLIGQGFDTVVAMRLVSKETEVYDTFDGYWGAYYGGGGFYGPSTYTETTVRVETNVFSLNQNRLVWSALSKTMDPESVNTVVDEVTSLVVADLRKKGVLIGSVTPQ